MPENDVIKNKDILGKEAQPIPVPEKEIGIDVNDEFANLIINAATNSMLDINSIDGLSNVAQTRETLYTLIDTMGNDDTVAAVLETYAEDVVDTNDDGRIVWCESEDADIASSINLLLDELNVDKNMYKWVYSLIKYGDLYLKLFRQDEYGEDVLFETDKEEKKDRRLNEDVEDKEKLQEAVKFHINTNNDPYATYVEAVANPGEMFELTRFGKTMGYVQAPVTVQTIVNQDSALNSYINYKMKKNDVNVYGAQDFVHAALRDDVERSPEEIDFFLTDEDYESNSHGGKYKVRRGQSILTNTFRVWRELTLLENSMLMNRLTRSAIIRILQMDMGEMPQNKVRDVLNRVKGLIEQKTSFKKDDSAGNYTNPGPMENIIILPSHGSQGVINQQTLGGDVNVKDIVDVDYFQNKLYGSLRAPKQYFCLHPDTELPLLDGTYPTIKEMYDNKDNYIGKGILSCDEDGKLVPTKITDIMLTRKDASFVKVTLDNGESLIVTPDHRIMLRDGSYKEAQDLEEGQSLMPYYEKINNKGRKLVLDNKSGKYLLQYRLVAEEKFEDIPKCNHRVIKVEKLNVIADAYDIEVESSNHNFPVKSGIFVHNCQTDDSTGFNGGTSLTIISSRYGKAIKRIQNTMCTLITDLVNLFLINRGLDNQVNNFTIKMQPPITQEELDKRENMRNRMGVNGDIMNQISQYVKDDLINVKILKQLLSNSVSDPEVINLIQEYIEELEKKQETKTTEDDETDETTPTEDTFTEEPPRTSPVSLEEPEFDLGGEESAPEEGGELEGGEESYLPTADEMGIDLTNGEF